MQLITRFVSVLLSAVLIHGSLSAQSPVSAQTSPLDSALLQSLQIRVVASDGPEVPVTSRSSNGFVLQVTDESGVPVADAAVTVRLPDAAPNGTFADGTHAAIAYTDKAGRAKISGITWGSTPGSVAIRATATKGTAHAGILINQTLISAQARTVIAPGSQPPAVQPKIAEPATPVTPPPPPAIAPPASTVAPSIATSTATPVAPPRIAEAPKLEVTVPGQPANSPDLRPAATISKAPASPSPLSPAAPAPNTQPAVSVVNSPGAEKNHSSKTKWIILAAVAAVGAGAGVAMMGKKSSSSSTTSTGISIGTPGISVGAPH